MTTVDFYLGLGSRYSYLAASQLDRIESHYDCRFAWKPIASSRLIERRGDNPFREPAAFAVEADVPALACLAADLQDALVPCCRRLFELVFVQGVALDAAAMRALPLRLGLDPATFQRDLESAETRARHESLTDEAAMRGAFGVPTFFLGDGMFWGNDRLPLLEAALSRHPRA